MSITLSINEERFIEAPDQATLKSEITALQPEDFVILCRAESVFLQAEISDDGSIILQHRNEPNPTPDSPPALMEASNPPASRDELTRVFSEYANGSASWNEGFEWAELEMVRIDYTIVVAAPEQKLGCFDPHHTELRTDFPEIAVERLKEFCALVLKKPVNRIASDFTPKDSPGVRWSVVSPAMLDALVAVPDAMIEKLVKKWVAADWFPTEIHDFHDTHQMIVCLLDLAIEASEQGISLAFCDV